MNYKIISPEFCLNFVLWFQVVAAIIGTIYYYKYKQTNFLKYFIFLLYYMAVNEFAALYYSRNIKIQNSVFFNIAQIFEFSFFLILYQKTLVKSIYKKILVVFLVLYYLSIVFFCVVDNFIEDFFGISYIIGSFFTSIGIIFYLAEILNSDRVFHLFRSLLFWISIGMLMYYVPSIPFWIVRRYFESSSIIPSIFYLNYFLVFLYNLLFIIGFIWSQKIQKD